jgi:hypothetical protein
MTSQCRTMCLTTSVFIAVAFGPRILALPSFDSTARAQTISPPCRNEAPGDFVTLIDNTYFPLQPGTTFVYDGSVDGQPARDVMQVTNDTKTIQGVRTTVVRDVLYLNGVLAEDTLDWYAQDRGGNVCYFGEDTKEFDSTGTTVVSTEGSWQAGKNGAQPGAIMLANPQPGDSYAQESAPGVSEDHALVLSVTKTVKVAYGSFSNVLETRETTPLDLSDVSNKYYAPNIGEIFETAKKGGKEQFQLVSITKQ